MPRSGLCARQGARTVARFFLSACAFFFSSAFLRFSSSLGSAARPRCARSPILPFMRPHSVSGSPVGSCASRVRFSLVSTSEEFCGARARQPAASATPEGDHHLDGGAPVPCTSCCAPRWCCVRGPAAAACESPALQHSCSSPPSSRSTPPSGSAPARVAEPSRARLLERLEGGPREIVALRAAPSTTEGAHRCVVILLEASSLLGTAAPSHGGPGERERRTTRLLPLALLWATSVNG